MRRVAEIIHIVEAEREAFLHQAIHPDTETERVLWLCGVRNQVYFSLNDLIFMTFEYQGKDFAEDMRKMSAYLDAKGHLVELRRKDVPAEQRDETNWWAPVKKAGSLLEHSPLDPEKDVTGELDYTSMLDGYMGAYSDAPDLSYSEEDWEDGIRI